MVIVNNKANFNDVFDLELFVKTIEQIYRDTSIRRYDVHEWKTFERVIKYFNMELKSSPFSKAVITYEFEDDELFILAAVLEALPEQPGILINLGV